MPDKDERRPTKRERMAAMVKEMREERHRLLIGLGREFMYALVFRTDLEGLGTKANRTEAAQARILDGLLEGHGLNEGG